MAEMTVAIEARVIQKRSSRAIVQMPWKLRGRGVEEVGKCEHHGRRNQRKDQLTEGLVRAMPVEQAPPNEVTAMNKLTEVEGE